MTARRYLARIDARSHRALDASLRPLIAAWGADGWAIVGRPPRLRIAVLVPRKLPAPPTPAGVVPLPRALGGGVLKVAVLATHRDDAEPERTAAPLDAGAGTDYLAPGAPIGGDNERIGIGAVIAIDGAAHIVTCGHAFEAGATTITTLAGEDVGELRASYFASGLDAAVFEPNARGLELLADGTDAPTWCDGFRAPDAADNGRAATFWPTWRDGGAPFLEDVVAYSSCAPATAGCGSVLLPRCTAPGDSGSLLQLDGRYYAIASHRFGNNSFFTPIAAIKKRIEASGSQVTPWRPE